MRLRKNPKRNSRSVASYLAAWARLILPQYKIELRLRNHNTLTREKLIPELAQCVPEGHTVSLDDPELCILVEIFKASSVMLTATFLFQLISFVQSVCGISVVKDYYKLQKFNVMEIANAKNQQDGNDTGRVAEKEKEEGAPAAVPAPSVTAAGTQ